MTDQRERAVAPAALADATGVATPLGDVAAVRGAGDAGQGGAVWRCDRCGEDVPAGVSAREHYRRPPAEDDPRWGDPWAARRPKTMVDLVRQGW